MMELDREFQRPLIVEAETINSIRPCHAAITLFAPDDSEERQIGMILGSGGNLLWCRPTCGHPNHGLEMIWRKMRIEADAQNGVKFFLNDEQVGEDQTSDAAEGKVRFINSCGNSEVEWKNIKVWQR